MALAARLLPDAYSTSSAVLTAFACAAICSGAVLAQDVLAMRRFVPDIPDVQILIAGKPPLQRAFSDVMLALGLPNAIQVAPDVSARMGICGALRIAQ